MQGPSFTGQPVDFGVDLRSAVCGRAPDENQLKLQTFVPEQFRRLEQSKMVLSQMERGDAKDAMSLVIGRQNGSWLVETDWQQLHGGLTAHNGELVPV